MDSFVKISIIGFLLGIANAYKAVVFMHGIFGSSDEGRDFETWIKQVHPDTPFYSIALYQRLNSLVPLWKQIEIISKDVVGIMNNHTDGIHLICFSQGGLICRGILSTTRHNVDTFISLSSPLAGQYGDTAYLKYLFPELLKSELYRLLYTKEGQDLSIGNYWKDPHHLEKYQKYSNFLAPLNNDTNTPKMGEYKQNFLRLNRLVLIGGPDDGVITPWQSSHFAFYNSEEKVVEIEQQRYFLEDSFGLKTLFNQRKVKIYVIPGVQHIYWHSNRTVFNTAILPWLI
ncbi:lysosomal thioesterase PPT2-A-like isoform X2 [Saccostrea echinata]|uniref:lysosomal thioesterase PPT2-A-like isoform X2 n=1 Tax=Saccostrea echinata TaxID=191078 RepID=UPI002A807BDA|nr:lysosomal thioesterase PPT2-A-like isoform X2 [Saccostrea echinata]